MHHVFVSTFQTVYGEVLPLQSNSDVIGLSRYILCRLLGNPDIAQEYAHPSVPHLYRDGKPCLPRTLHVLEWSTCSSYQNIENYCTLFFFFTELNKTLSNGNEPKVGKVVKLHFQIAPD